MTRSRPAILDHDLAEVRALLSRRLPIDGFIVPVPHKFVRAVGARIPGLMALVGIADGARYATNRGFFTQGAH